jgi:hypothetical protein
MRALKVLVVVMGVLLVGGTAALIAAIINRASHRAATPVVSSVPAHGFDRTVIDLPEGGQLLGTEVVGDRILVRVALEQGGEELILLDPRSGARVGTIDVRPSGASGSKQ